MTGINRLGISNNVYEGHEAVNEIAKQGLARVKAEQEAVISDPNLTTAQKREALEGLDKAEQKYVQVLNNSSMGMPIIGTMVDVANVTEKNLDASWKMLESAEASMAKVDVILGNSAATGSTQVGSPENRKGVMMEHVVVVDAVYVGSSAQSSKVDNANSRADRLMEMMNADPDQFMKEFKEMSPEDRQSSMMIMNDRLQSANQMFSMMSNMSKAQHDTAKAMINNMRV